MLDFTSFSGRLSYERGRVRATYRDGFEKYASIAEISVLIIADKTDISTGLLSMLGQNGIPVIVTDWRKVPVSIASSWSTHTRVGARQIAQAKNDSSTEKGSLGEPRSREG
nr:CRISPR-associated endonuclease Cas1 [Corynebacterium lactis]